VNASERLARFVAETESVPEDAITQLVYVHPALPGVVQRAVGSLLIRG
jgi:hypothetical protein